MWWLALHLPQLSLEAFSATLAPAQRAGPVALLDAHRIAAVNGAAAERGIRPGFKRATALALAGELLIGQADAARDGQALQAVAHTALAFTPMVVPEGGQAVLLEAQGSLRYFGGPQQLCRRLRDALAPLGHRLRLAGAPTAAGAALLAQWGAAPLDGDPAWGPHSTDLGQLRRLLDGAPVAFLGPAGHEHAAALQGMGLHTLAELRALPRAGLARRFGATLLDTLDRARGDCPDPRQPIVPAPAFDSRLELHARADSTVQVLDGAAVLLARLVAWAQAQQARVGGFTLRMEHERSARPDHAGPPHTELTVELAEPSADPAHLQLLLRERLARCELAAPTLDLRLHCHHLVKRAAPNGELFPSRQGEQEGLTRLLERLRARLGDARVQSLQTQADHRPERAHRLQPVAQLPVSAPAPSLTPPAPALPPAHPALPLHRPAWLLTAPEPLAVRGETPLLDGRPLQLLGGPERIEAGWWDAGGLAMRDYFVAQAADGALVWVFCTRLTTPSGWYLQGRFA